MADEKDLETTGVEEEEAVTESGKDEKSGKPGKSEKDAKSARQEKGKRTGQTDRQILPGSQRRVQEDHLADPAYRGAQHRA